MKRRNFFEAIGLGFLSASSLATMPSQAAEAKPRQLTDDEIDEQIRARLEKAFQRKVTLTPVWTTTQQARPLNFTEWSQ